MSTKVTKIPPFFELSCIDADLLVASLYDFASAGSGTFSFDPVVNFRVASGSNSKLARVSNVNSSPVQVSVQNVGEKREVEKRATKKSIGKRAENICTDSTKKSFIDKSYTSGKSLAAAASKYASSGGKLTSAYFGTTDVKTVTGVLDVSPVLNLSQKALSHAILLECCPRR